MKIVINAATSQVGRAATAQLRELGHTVVLIARDPSKLGPDAGEVMVGSFEDAGVLAKACAGADALFWVAPPSNRPDGDAWAAACAVRAAGIARAAGVHRAVVLSSIGAQIGARAGAIAALIDIENAFTMAMENVTVLRAGLFFENLYRDLAAITADGVVRNPIPSDLRLPWVAVKDIGQRAAEALVDDTATGHHIRGVHGPADLSWAEIAQVVSRAIGRPVRHEQITVAAQREGLTAAGLPPHSVESYTKFFQAVADGSLAPAEPRSSATWTPTTLSHFARSELASRVAQTLAPKRFLLSFAIRPEVTFEQIAPHLPDEVKRFTALTSTGMVTASFFGPNRRSGWLVMRGRDIDDAKATAGTLPLSRFWELTATALEDG